MKSESSEPRAHRVFPVYPPLVACFPLLSLYSANSGLMPLSELWAPLAVAAGATCAVWLLATFCLRDVHRGAACAAGLTMSFLGFGRADELLHGRIPAAWLCGAWIVGTLGLFAIIVRGASLFRRASPILNFAGLAAVVVAGSSVIGAAGREAETPRYDPVVAARSDQPDVFYIVLDGYGRPDQLRRVMGFDDSTFVEGLRRRGFYVAEGSHTNYVQTELSLASTLNLDYVEKLLPAIDPASKERKGLDHMVDANRVAAALRSRGYRYVAVASGFPCFTFRSADRIYDRVGGYSFFAEAVINETPLARGSSVSSTMFDQRRDRLINAFAALRQLARRGSRPKFVLAHMLAPHPPFVFGPNGEPVQPKTMLFKIADGSHFMKNGGTPEEYRDGYVGQVQWLNKQVLGFLDELLHQRGPKPIVLIQGDHGSKLRIDVDSPSRSDLRECMSNLSAYLLPVDAAKRVYPAITPVNSFRLVLGQVFGENLPMLPDRSYFSPWSRPYELEDVTSQLAGKSAILGDPRNGEAKTGSDGPIATRRAVPRSISTGVRM